MPPHAPRRTGRYRRRGCAAAATPRPRPRPAGREPRRDPPARRRGSGGSAQRSTVQAPTPAPSLGERPASNPGSAPCDPMCVRIPTQPQPRFWEDPRLMTTGPIDDTDLTAWLCTHLATLTAAATDRWAHRLDAALAEIRAGAPTAQALATQR